MTVPVEEISSFAIKSWQAPNSIGAQIQNLTYLDLQTGRIVRADSIYDWNRALTYFNYTILLPNIVDMPAYQQAVQHLSDTLGNLTTGQTGASRSCQSPIPQLQGVSDYINTVLTQNLSDVSNINGCLRPTELKLPGGCISESSTNYEGTILQSIRTSKTSQVIVYKMLSTHLFTCDKRLTSNPLINLILDRSQLSKQQILLSNQS